MERCNKLTLIANGFDLAHGLKTSYHDFLYWYLQGACKKFIEAGNYCDDLMDFSKNINFKQKLHGGEVPETLEKIIEVIAPPGRPTVCNSNFFKRLTEDFR